MSTNNNDTNWKALQAELQKNLEAQGNSIEIADTPDFPLAFNVAMPEDHDYENGHMSFQFTDFSCEGLDQLTVVEDESSIDEGRIKMAIQFGPLALQGRYAIKSKYAPVIPMDLGGTMLEHDENDRVGKAAGSESDNTSTSPLTPSEKETMLTNARTQRSKLMETANGQQVMGMYNEHQEIYNFVFMSSSAVRGTWNTNGGKATVAMSRHTQNTVGTDNHINPHASEKTFGTQQISYNSNSLTQQLNVASGVQFADPKFNPAKPYNPDTSTPRFYAAYQAAFKFQKMVAKTGNTKTKVNPMNSAEIYGAVNDPANAEIPEVTPEEIQNLMDQSTGEAGAAETAEQNGWLVLTEDQRKVVQRNFADAMERRAFDSNNTSQTLYAGDCNGTLNGLEATLEFQLTPNAELLNCSVEVPGFELNLDDAAWTGESGELARERLAQVYFVRSLLHDQVQRSLKQSLDQAFPKGEYTA